MGESGVLAILGPTASGKTAVAVEVARMLDGEIISADSRQVYRGMDIGTAKPSRAERAGIPHHGFDMVAPGERYSAGRFARDAWCWIDAIQERGRVPIVAGGTGFFLRALTHPMFDEPDASAEAREAIKRVLDQFPQERLVEWADALDPTGGWGSGRRGGRQRAARAVEIALRTGRPLSWWQKQEPRGRVLAPMVFVLELPRDVLYDRINRRVDVMLESGLVEEVRRLKEQGLTAADPGMNATGYVEVLRYLEGDTGLDTAAEQIRAATRRYARRQLTWLRHQLPDNAVRIDANAPAAEVGAAIVLRWREEQEVK